MLFVNTFRLGVLMVVAMAACSGSSNGDRKGVTSDDVAAMETACRANGHRKSDRTECVVDAFCRCAALDYQGRTTNRDEYRSIMSSIDSFLDRSGYYCTSRAEYACPA